MAKQIINIGVTANDGSGDPLRNAFDKTNDNFNELYLALGDANNPVNLFDTEGNLDINGTPNKISFLYSTEAELLAVDPSTYHGSIGHAHDTGALYYAHGAWRKVLADTSGGTITNYTDPLNSFVYSANILNSEVDGYVLGTSANGSYSWVEATGGGSEYADSDVDAHINVGGAQANEVLQWSGTDYQWASLFGSGDVDTHLNSSSAQTNEILSWNGSDYAWISQSGGGSYSDNDVSAHLNVSAAQTNQILSWTGSDFAWVADQTGGGGGSFGTSDVDTHLNTGSAQTNQILSWTGSDYAWVADQTGGGGGGSYADSDVDAHLNVSGATSNQFLQWTGTDYQWAAAGGGGSSTFASLTEIDAADLDVHDIALQAKSNYVMTGPDSSRYLIDQLPGDNPTIYATAGETIAINIDGVTSMHPLEIRQSDGITQYDTGLIHYAPDGTKSTGSNAQGKTTGTLFWKIPGNISGTYKYICNVHSSMIGDIVITDPSAGAGGLETRTTKTLTVNGLADGANADSIIDGFKSFALMQIQTSHAAWVRLYVDTASRTADSSRTETTDPAPDAGVIAEVITSGAETVKFGPAVLGWLSSGNQISAAIKNKSGATNNVQVTLTLLKLEA